MINLKTQDGETILTIDENKEQPVKKIVHRQKTTITLCVIILVILLSLSGFLALVTTKVVTKQIGLVAIIESQYIPDIIPDPDPIVVPIPEEEKIDDLNEKLDGKKMCINMISSITFKDAYASGRFNIVNSKANNYPQFVTITLNSNNAVIYQSGLIDPGKCIPYDTLDVVLPKGTYECTATFAQVDTAANRVCGKAAAKVVITVQK